VDNRFLHSTLASAKACLPYQLKRTGLAVGLDLTVFAFINQIPENLITEDVLKESALRAWKYASELEGSEFALEPEYFKEISGKDVPSTKYLRNQIISDFLKIHNNFNNEGQRLGAIFIKNDTISVILSKDLTSGSYSKILDKLGDQVKVHGGNKMWRFTLAQHNVVDFILPSICEKFSILGLSEYQDDIEQRRHEVDVTPLTRALSPHYVPKNVIFDVTDEHIEILAGSEKQQSCFPFLRKINTTEDESPFVITHEYARVIPAMIEMFGEDAHVTSELRDSLEMLCAEGLDEFTIFQHGGIASPLFCVLETKMTYLNFTFYHHPRSDELTNRLRKDFPKAKFSKNKNFIPARTIKDIEKISKVCADLSIPTYYNPGTFNETFNNYDATQSYEGYHYFVGDDAFNFAVQYINNVADKPKATIDYRGGRTFEIYQYATGNEQLFNAGTREKTDQFQAFINKMQPCCDQRTCDAVVGIDDLGVYRAESKNGKLFAITPIVDIHSSDASYLDLSFLPPHCVREEGRTRTIRPLTASMAITLRDRLKEYGMLSKEDRETVIPALTSLIDIFQSRLDKSYTNSGTIQVENFLGNELAEPEQRGCVEYVLPIKRSLIADEPGFGKTWESLMVVAHANAWPCFITMPRIGKLTWFHEFNRLTQGKKVVILGVKNVAERQTERDEIKSADVVLVNYDMLGEFKEDLKQVKFNSAIIDESHYTKNEDAQRTQNTHEIIASSSPEYILPMSGSHWENNPIELWTTIVLLRMQHLFGSFEAYKKRYCFNPAKQDYSGFNLDELNEICRTHFMIRRQKSGEGARKWRQSYIPIQDLALNAYRKEETAIAHSVLNFVKPFIDKAIEKNPELASQRGILMEEYIRKNSERIMRKIESTRHWATARNLIGQAKVNGAIEWIESMLEQEEKLVVFAWHKEVQRSLYEHFSKSGIETVKIDSDMNDTQRHEAAKQFREGTPRLIICSIGAASENINLASSSHVLFVENHVKPLTQARKRIDRKPQTARYLNAWYLRAIGTLDDLLCEMSEKKLEAFTKGSGDTEEAPIQKLNTDDFAATIVKNYLMDVA
tara:strand:+ start:2965 stop:6180 length:3216 start_codon:yes stop_codon:yes gene_type:complete